MAGVCWLLSTASFSELVCAGDSGVGVKGCVTGGVLSCLGDSCLGAGGGSCSAGEVGGSSKWLLVVSSSVWQCSLGFFLCCCLLLPKVGTYFSLSVGSAFLFLPLSLGLAIINL